MKKITQLILVALFVCVGVGTAFAYPIADEDSVYLRVSDKSVPSLANGNYDVYKVGDSTSSFSTFCLQMETTFRPGSYYKATIDSDIRGYLSSDTNYPGPGLLVDATKYLFWNFSLGTLQGYEGNSGDVAALQNAIWKLQGYSVDVSNNEFYSLATSLTAIDTGAMNVKVMNLWSGNGSAAQSQLIAGSAPVPEPATLVLLGSGLAGLAFYRRRMKK